MTNKGVEKKPSETALIAALRRYLAYKEYSNEKFGPDYLANIFLPSHFRFFLKIKKIRLNTKNKLDKFIPGGKEYMIARTAYFDGHFVDALKNNVPQIVLLGAGYDSRAYRFTELNQGTQIFELDVAPTQDRKKKCLKKARLTVPQHIKLVPINFNEDTLGDVLEEAGYKNREKTLFIWEGVTYYLDAKSVDAVLEFVSHSAHSENAIAFDYTVSISEENIQDHYGVKEFAQTMKDHHGDEELTFSIDDDEIVSFLDNKNLTMIDHMNNEEIESSYLLNEKGLLLGPITGHFRFVFASKTQSRR